MVFDILIMLKIQNLSVSYGSRHVLHDISLNVQSGEILALIGPNGAGKSTLIRAASGVIPYTGHISTSGDDFASLSALQRARLETVLFGRTPYLGFLGQPSPKDEDIVRQSLQRVSALPFADRRVGELSGGEQQRVLLARALCQSTPILLLDEPTTHLDLQYQVSLLELISELAHKDNLAVLVALHDLNLAAHYADRIALMVAGNIKAMGTPREVLMPELIAEAYCLPVQVVKHPFLDIPLVLPEAGK